MVAVSSSRNPSSNRGRFSRSTKAVKPATATTASTENEQPRSSGSSGGSSRVEVLVTPTKAGKRRRMEDSDELENAAGDHSSRDAAFITPTKRHSPAKNAAYLPTPPITPTISISAAHEDEHDANSQQLVSSPAQPVASTSASVEPSEKKHAHANIYARARSLFRLSASAERLDESDEDSQLHTHTQLVGREAERKQLNEFLSAHMPELFPGSSPDGEPAGSTSTGPATRKGNSEAPPSKVLYISGSPGTGKTALLHSIIANLRSRHSQQRSEQALSVALLNCTTVQRAEDIWARLAAELDLSLPSSSTASRGSARKKSVPACKVGWNRETFATALLAEAGEKRLVVLDEIDHLLPEISSTGMSKPSSSTTPSNVLSELFSLAMDPDSPLVLIGIANALDLTQRYRALLFGDTSQPQAQTDMNRASGPQLLHFRPFQADEMVSIVKQRLQSLHAPPQITTLSNSTPQASSVQLPLPIVMPAALELAAKKVAAVTGDLRAFLSLVRKAVEIFESEQRKRFLELEKTTMTTMAAAAMQDEGPDDSPTKKRKLLSSASSSRKSPSCSRQRQEGAYTDPLARFDASNAPKLTPAHILKATRAVSLSSSSAASHSSSSSNNGSMNASSSAGALSAASSNQHTLLQAKIGELNLHQRVALTAFLILLARRISASVPAWALGWAGSHSTNSEKPSAQQQQQQQQQQPIDIDSEASSVPNGGARPSELHALYKALLEKEDLLQPVSSSEFSDLLSGLHTRGLVGLEKEMARFGTSLSSTSPAPMSGASAGLAPPMMRRTSSSSSVGSNGAGSSMSSSGRASRSPSPNTAAGRNGAQAPLYLLYPFTALHSVLAPTISPANPSTSTATTTTTTTSESASICANLLNKESKRLRRIQKMNTQLENERKERELAPRAGFSGDGLDKGPAGGREYVGSKDRRGRREMAADDEGDDDDDEHEKREKREEKRAAERDEAGLEETSASLRDAYGINADW